MDLIYDINKKKFFLVGMEGDTPDEDEFHEVSEKGVKKRIKKFTKEACIDFFKVVPFISEGILESLKNTDENKRPSELIVDFSVGFNGEGNVLFVKAGINAEFSVQLKWNDIKSKLHDK